jgi:hypothetical protein
VAHPGGAGTRPGALHPEQVKLLWGAGSNYQHFIQAHLPEDGAEFIFGRVIRMPEWLERYDLHRTYAGREDEYLLKVQEFLARQAIDGQVFATITSSRRQDGTDQWVAVRNLWPIRPAFYVRASLVGWNMSDLAAPLDALEDTMRRFRRLMTPSSHGA